MCGRYSQSRPLSDLQRRFNARPADVHFRARYNIAPTQPAPVVVGSDDRVLDQYRWGLIPSWAKDPRIGNKMINARAETVDTKPAFRTLFRTNRCLVVADGFYEWRTIDDKTRAPMRIQLASEELMAFAGLWSLWRDVEGYETRSFTILTTAPNELMMPIHDRMPVILRPRDEERWLDPTTSLEDLRALLGLYPAEEMHAYQVSNLVNSPRNDSPAVLVPAGGEAGSLF